MIVGLPRWPSPGRRQELFPVAVALSEPPKSSSELREAPVPHSERLDRTGPMTWVEGVTETEFTNHLTLLLPT
jgi:hypothetical protein